MCMKWPESAGSLRASVRGGVAPKHNFELEPSGKNAAAVDSS